MAASDPGSIVSFEKSPSTNQATLAARISGGKLRSNLAKSASGMDGVARALPALLRAEKLQRRAAKVGFDWPTVAGPMAKIQEELKELSVEVERGSERDRLEDELGDLLFSCVNLARHLGVGAEAALRGANDKFERRFRAMEAVDGGAGFDALSLEQLDLRWQAAKREVE